MLSKLQKKGLNVAAAVLVSGIGTASYIPKAYAESSVGVETNQETSLLSKLEVEGVELDKEFSPNEKDYSAVVENHVDSISLLLESNNQAAKINVNGQSFTSGISTSYMLKTGINTITIEINDGSSTNTYTLTITRKQNSDNRLQAIMLSDGNLSPAFSPDVMDYTIEVPNTTNSITITPIAFENTAVIKLNNQDVRNGGSTIQLTAEKTTVVIVVTAENGDQRTYTIHVTRMFEQAGNGTGTPAQSTNGGSSYQIQTTRGSSSSGNSFSSSLQSTGSTQVVSKAKLSTLKVSSGTWDSDFTADEYTYHVTVSSDVQTITITPTAVNSTSTLLIGGSTSKTVTLEEDGKTIIPIVVSYDDTDRKTYVLVFDRKS